MMHAGSNDAKVYNGYHFTNVLDDSREDAGISCLWCSLKARRRMACKPYVQNFMLRMILRFK